MASEVVKVVDPNQGTGWDYNSLASWDAGEAADIVTADEQHTAKCRCTGGTADTSAYSSSASWVTDATRYVKIWTDPAEAYRHNGTYQTGNKYRIERGSTCLTNSNIDYLRIIGLQFQMTISTALSRDAISLLSTTGKIYAEKNIVKGVLSGTATTCKGIAHSASGDLSISNNIVYDFTGGAASDHVGFRIGAGGGDDVYIFNNTAQNCDRGYVSTATANMTIKNCIAQDCSDYCYDAVGWDTASHNCDDDSPSTAPGSDSQNGEVLFADEGADDFHLSGSDTVAKDNGTDLSSDGNYPITDDIDGDTRSGSWDIGADEIAGGTTHEAVATVVGKGLLGAIAAALLLASANATVIGKGLLGDVAVNMDWSGDATVVGKGLLGDITPNVDYTSPEATVVGKGLLGTIDGDIISASAGRAVPTYLKHEGSVLFDGTSGTEVWVGFYVYASDTYNATVGRPAIINHATTNWLQIGRGHLQNSLGICRENADTGNRLSVGLGGYITQLSVKGAVAVDDTIYGRASYGTQASYFETIGASTGLGNGWICGIAKSTNTTGVGTIKAWLFPWKV